MNDSFPALGMFVEHVGVPVKFEPDPERFRQVLGHFASGITIITAIDDGEPVGFSCQAFAALSLDPPLVLFCPSRRRRRRGRGSSGPGCSAPIS